MISLYFNLINFNSFRFQTIEDEDDSTFTAGLGASMPGLDDHDEADHVEDQDQDRFLPSEESRRGDESEESEDTSLKYELIPSSEELGTDFTPVEMTVASWEILTLEDDPAD